MIQRLLHLPLPASLVAIVAAGLVVQGAAIGQQGGGEKNASLQAALGIEEAFSSVAERLFPTLVCVTAYKRVDDDEGEGLEGAKLEAWRLTGKASPYRNFHPMQSGSGFFLDDEGHILTCLHTITGPDGELARVVGVEVGGQNSLCRVVGTEPTLNLALLKLEVVYEGAPPKYEVPSFIKDLDTLRPGQWAISLGDPGGALRTFSVGTFAALPSRDCYQNDLTSTYIQACMTVHPGAYGGVVANIRGEVVGILTTKNSGPIPSTAVRGIEFLLPIPLVINIADALKVAESFESPWLGFSVLDLSVRLSQIRKQDPAALRKRKPGEKQAWPLLGGVYIDDVYDPSPATRAGIRPGDYLVSIDGQKLLTPFNFQRQLYLAGIGREVVLEYFRDGETHKVTTTIEARPKEAVTH